MGNQVVDKKILDIQCASTRRCLERPETEDVDWLSRPIPKESQVRDEHGNVDKGHRLFTNEEWAVASSLQRNRGKYIGAMRGEKAELRERSELIKRGAIDRFMGIFSVDTIKLKFRELMGTVPKEKTYAEIVADHMKKVQDE